MTAVVSLPRQLPDPLLRAHWPAELRLLLGGEAAGILAAAVATAGGELQGWAPRQVTHQPSSSTVVQYRAEVRWPRGRTSSETVVAATGSHIPAGAALLEDGATRVGVWRWPFDPSLPGLATALDRERVARLLDDLGVDGGTVQLRVRAYRPGRRAVVEATGGRGRLFLKVVRPHTVEVLHDMHRTLAACLPVPDSLGWTGDGVLVLPARPGRTLRELLRSGHSTLPPLAQVESLLDRLPHGLAGGQRRRDLVASAAHHGRVIASVLPVLADEVGDLVDEVRGRELGEHALVGVHGDLHEAQLLLAGGRLTGLLDVDTAGAGHRVEDIATLCAHLSVLALASARPKVIKRYGAVLLADAETRFDRTDLRTRIAAGVIGLATGPFRVLESGWPQNTRRRLDLARAWLADRNRDEEGLTPLSRPSHRRTAP